MVVKRFAWPYGGHRASFYASFTGWTECPMELVVGEFQVLFDLPPGVYQYRFFVDGIWRCDELKPCVHNEYGIVSNEIVVEDHTTPVVQQESSVIRGMNMDDGIPLSTMHPEPSSQTSGAQITVFCHRVCELLLHNTIFDIVPVSSKVSILDARLPVKQAFDIMHGEGLTLVPLWDEQQGTITGMLTASDFVLILRKLQKNIRGLGREELEMHSVAAWKEEKLKFFRRPDGVVGMHRRSLIHAKDTDSLMDVALKIVRNEISSVPIFKSSLPDSSSMPLLNLASLPEILKFLCSKFQEEVGDYPFLQHPIISIPLGTWSTNVGRPSNSQLTRQLTTLRRSTPLNSALDLLLKDRVSSIPIVDDNGSFLDVYSLSDIMALAKNDIYTRIELEHMTVEHALELEYQVNGRRQCRTCLRTTPFLDILEQLTIPGVRRLVVVDPRTRFVEGIISLRDVFTFLLALG